MKKCYLFYSFTEQSYCFAFKHAFDSFKPVKDANNTYLLKGTYFKYIR